MNIDETMVSLALKFSSGNEIAVERATILREEYEAIKEMYDTIGQMNKRMKTIVDQMELQLIEADDSTPISR